MVTLREKQLKGGSSGHRPSWQRKKVVEEMAHISSSRARRLLAQCPPEVGSFAPPLCQWELSALYVLNLLLSFWGEQLSGNDFHHFPPHLLVSHHGHSSSHCFSPSREPMPSHGWGFPLGVKWSCLPSTVMWSVCKGGMHKF